MMISLGLALKLKKGLQKIEKQDLGDLFRCCSAAWDGAVAAENMFKTRPQKLNVAIAF